MIDYRKEAITSNDELIAALECNLVLLRLHLDTAPSSAIPLIKDDIEKRIQQVEQRKIRAITRKKDLEKEGK